MKISFKSPVIALSLTLLISQSGPVLAQSLSDAVGTQSHNFAPATSTLTDKPLSKPKIAHHHIVLVGHKSFSAHTVSNFAKSKATTADIQQPAGTATIMAADQTASLPKSKVKVPLTPAQIKHHLKMLALRAAHRKAHSALNGFDQVGAKSTDLDSLTRDGSQPASASNDVGTRDLSIGSAIGRALAALAIVLGMAYGTLKFMRSRGIGVSKTAGTSSISSDESGIGLHLQSAGPTTIDQFQRVIQAAQAKQTSEETFSNGYQKIEKSIQDLEILGSQELPGTAHTLYKVKIGDRILLLGGSLSGALTSLTEWDVETKPETEQQFENVLTQMTMSVAQPTPTPVVAPVISTAAPNLAGGSQADALRTATQRLSRSARRMSEVGRAANDAS